MNVKGLAVAAALAMLIGACSKAPAPAANTASRQNNSPASSAQKTPAPAADKKLTIGVMPKLVGIDYFNATEAGAKKAAQELGVEIDYNGPVSNDVTKQAELVETWITKKYDAIAIAPNDPDAIAVALEKARKRGIKVVTWDSDAKKSARDFFVNQATAEGIARTLMDLMAQAIGENGKYINITGSLTASNQNLWMEEMEKYRKTKYPNLRNLSETPKASEEDQAKATQVAADCLKTYPDLQGIFALTSVALPGAAEALRKANAADRIFLTGLATPKAMKQYVQDGTVKKFVLWNAEDLGYLAVYAAVASVKGSLAPGATELEAGHLKKVKINGDEVLLGDPIVFTKDNIDQFNF